MSDLESKDPKRPGPVAPAEEKRSPAASPQERPASAAAQDVAQVVTQDVAQDVTQEMSAPAAPAVAPVESGPAQHASTQHSLNQHSTQHSLRNEAPTGQPTTETPAASPSLSIASPAPVAEHAPAGEASETADSPAKSAPVIAEAINPEPVARPEPGARIRLEKKHRLVIRWMHWINFPVLFTMIWSGLLIYWGDSDRAYKHPHQVYRIGLGPITVFRFFPTWFWTWYHAPFQITKGLGYHFFFMWIFFINGLIYVLYTIFSGEWRYLAPNRESFREAMEVTLHDLGLRKEHPPKRKYNGAQQIAYTAIIAMGLGSLLTGLAIYKPTQVHLLTTLLGGYEMARWLHFWLTIGYCVFFVIHVAQVVRAGWNNFRSMVSGYEVVPASDPPFAATARHPARGQASYE